MSRHSLTLGPLDTLLATGGNALPSSVLGEPTPPAGRARQAATLRRGRRQRSQQIPHRPRNHRTGRRSICGCGKQGGGSREQGAGQVAHPPRLWLPPRARRWRRRPWCRTVTPSSADRPGLAFPVRSWPPCFTGTSPWQSNPSPYSSTAAAPPWTAPCGRSEGYLRHTASSSRRQPRHPLPSPPSGLGHSPRRATPKARSRQRVDDLHALNRIGVSDQPKTDQGDTLQRGSPSAAP